MYIATVKKPLLKIWMGLLLMNSKENEVADLNDILERILEVNRDLFDFAENSKSKELQKLTYSTIVALGSIIQSNSTFLMNYLNKITTKERDDKEFEQLMSQLEEKTIDGKE